MKPINSMYMKKIACCLWFFCACFFLSAHDYTIRFEKTWMADPLDGNGVIAFMTEGASKVHAVNNIVHVYKGEGLQLGLRETPGSVSFELSDQGRVLATKIEIVVNTFDSQSRSLQLTLGNHLHTFSGITSLQTCSLDLDSTEITNFSLSTIKEATAEINIESITIEYVPSTVNSLSDLMRALPNSYFLKNDLIVMYVHNSTVYACDSTSGVRFEDSGTLLVSGDTMRNVEMEMQQNMFGNTFVCNAYSRFPASYAYVPIVRDSLTQVDENRYVVLKDVVVESQGGGMFTMLFDGQQYEIIDDYVDVSALEDAHYDVSGIYFSALTQKKFNLLYATKLPDTNVALESNIEHELSYVDGQLYNPDRLKVRIFNSCGNFVYQTVKMFSMPQLESGIYFVVTDNKTFKIVI